MKAKQGSKAYTTGREEDEMRRNAGNRLFKTRTQHHRMVGKERERERERERADEWTVGPRPALRC